MIAIIIQIDCIYKPLAFSILIKHQSRNSASFSFFTSGLVTNLRKIAGNYRYIAVYNILVNVGEYYLIISFP